MKVVNGDLISFINVITKFLTAMEANKVNVYSVILANHNSLNVIKEENDANSVDIEQQHFPKSNLELMSKGTSLIDKDVNEKESNSVPIAQGEFSLKLSSETPSSAVQYCSDQNVVQCGVCKVPVKMCHCNNIHHIVHPAEESATINVKRTPQTSGDCDKRQLSLQNRIHRKEDVFKCEVCQKECRSHIKLKLHMIVHKKVKTAKSRMWGHCIKGLKSKYDISKYTTRRMSSCNEKYEHKSYENQDSINGRKLENNSIEMKQFNSSLKLCNVNESISEERDNETMKLNANNEDIVMELVDENEADSESYNLTQSLLDQTCHMSNCNEKYIPKSKENQDSVNGQKVENNSIEMKQVNFSLKPYFGNTSISEERDNKTMTVDANNEDIVIDLVDEKEDESDSQNLTKRLFDKASFNGENGQITFIDRINMAIHVAAHQVENNDTDSTRSSLMENNNIDNEKAMDCGEDMEINQARLPGSAESKEGRNVYLTNFENSMSHFMSDDETFECGNNNANMETQTHSSLCKTISNKYRLDDDMLMLNKCQDEHLSMIHQEIDTTTINMALDLVRYKPSSSHQLNLVEQKTPTFTCNFCPNMFDSLDNLSEHLIQNHDGVHFYCCDVCEIVFWNKQELANHTREYHGEIFILPKAKISTQTETLGDSSTFANMKSADMMNLEKTHTQEDIAPYTDDQIPVTEETHHQQDNPSYNDKHITIEAQLEETKFQEDDPSSIDKQLPVIVQLKETDHQHDNSSRNDKHKLDVEESDEMQFQEDNPSCNNKQIPRMAQLDRRNYHQDNPSCNDKQILQMAQLDGRNYHQDNPSCNDKHIPVVTQGEETQVQYITDIIQLENALLKLNKKHEKTPTRDLKKVKEKPDVKYKCDICGKSYKIHFSLIRHKLKDHRGKRVLENEPLKLNEKHEKTQTQDLKKNISDLKYKCDICEKSFQVENSLVKHSLQYHSGKRVYHCKICKKSFTDNDDLDKHIREHDGISLDIVDNGNNTISLQRQGEKIKPYQCDVCKKCYPGKEHLQRHKKRHQRVALNCPQCPSTFWTQSSLRSHISSHTGKWAYNCHICDRHFNQKKDLTIHEMMHTGERPFKCGHCDKGFTVKSSLHYHVRVCKAGSNQKEQS